MSFTLDIITNVKGVNEIGFDECFQYSVLAEIENIPARFLHYNHFITSKKAAGRPRDLVDIEELEKIYRAGEDD